LIAGALAVVLGIGLAVYLALSTWSQVNRVDIDRPDPDVAGDLVQQPRTDEDGESSGSDEDADPDPAQNTDGTEVFLLVGSDSREALSDTSGFGAFEGRRADVVMVVIRARGETAIMSLPRDLWVESVCAGEMTRLNEELEGCDGLLNGPSLLTLTVENLIGETIDHIALVDLAGFQEAVDELGGYEICLERPVRDERANLELSAGCTMASGEQALAWLRSRHTQELTEGGWRLVPGVNDLARNERQRDFLIDMMGRLSDFTSPQALASTARAISPHITVDSELSLVTAVELAWALRGIGEGDVTELEVPVVDHTTEAGAAVLLASTPVQDLVSEFLAPETAGEEDSVIES
jgi:LCP family protein required for cell wall assembly